MSEFTQCFLILSFTLLVITFIVYDKKFSVKVFLEKIIDKFKKRT